MSSSPPVIGDITEFSSSTSTTSVPTSSRWLVSRVLIVRTPRRWRIAADTDSERRPAAAVAPHRDHRLDLHGLSGPLIDSDSGPRTPQKGKDDLRLTIHRACDQGRSV